MNRAAQQWRHLLAGPEVVPDPLPLRLGPPQGDGAGGDRVCEVVRVATQHDRVYHEDLQRLVTAGDREAQLVVVVGILPAITEKLSL